MEPRQFILKAWYRSEVGIDGKLDVEYQVESPEEGLLAIRQGPSLESLIGFEFFRAESADLPVSIEQLHKRFMQQEGKEQVSRSDA